eukprot:5764035-Pyramimonas_sp.AAC.1
MPTFGMLRNTEPENMKGKGTSYKGFAQEDQLMQACVGRVSLPAGLCYGVLRPDDPKRFPGTRVACLWGDVLLYDPCVSPLRQDHYRFAKVPGYSTLFLLDRGSKLSPPETFSVEHSWTIPEGMRCVRVRYAECRFTEKVINAELAGADAVLICDNVEEQLITMDAGDDMSTLK